jgi:autotransporter strand-loop-strand O-heptosyltransferase
VVIATQASSQAKYWNNPNGWHEVIAYLKSKGYRVLCIDKNRVCGAGVVWNHIPHGAEDFTGDLPLQKRINLIKDADMFIGLSSGLSWLAWCCKVPVLLISGFTAENNEFHTPYRVINHRVCHSCWNDMRCDFDHFDFLWCPRHKNTERQFECTKFITPKMVIDKIKIIKHGGKSCK